MYIYFANQSLNVSTYLSLSVSAGIFYSTSSAAWMQYGLARGSSGSGKRLFHIAARDVHLCGSLSNGAVQIHSSTRMLLLDVEKISKTLSFLDQYL